MPSPAKTPPGRATTRAVLEQIVRGERGRQLRAKVARLNSDVDRDRVDDAFQAACERADRRCRGQSEGEVYQWLFTTMVREISAMRNALQRETPVDWSPDSLARFRRCEHSAAAEVVDREEQAEISDLTIRVLDDLTDRQRAVAVLYSHGLQRNEIAAQLDVTPRIVKRSLERLLSSGRRRLIRLAGGGCPAGEPLVARHAFGLGSKRDIERAQMHLATCPRCGAMYERLDLWREQVAATVPIPAVVGSRAHVAERLAQIGGDVAARSGAQGADVPVAPRGHVTNAIAHLREYATGLYARTFDPTPLAGARPGTVAAAIAGCIALGSGAGYCVDQNVDLGSFARFAGFSASSAHSHHPAKHPTPRVRAAQAGGTTMTAEIVSPPTPPPTTLQAAPPPAIAQSAPPPAPEDQFQPTSAGAAASSTTATTASAPIPKPKAAPANGAPEFGGP